MSRRCPFICLIAFFCFAGAVGYAQDDAERLTVPWAEIRPLFVEGAQGGVTGFGPEVLRLIAERAGFDIDFQRHTTIEDMLDVQISGRGDVLPGIARLPELATENVFSAPVAQTHVRLYMRREAAQLGALEALPPMRLSIPDVLRTPELTEQLAAHELVTGPPGWPALVALLQGKVDGIIGTDAVIFSEALSLRLDHRIVAVGPVLQTFDRVVVVSRRHAALVPQIDAAIAQMERDGTLAELRHRTFLDVPPPAPPVLKVGVYHFPPFNIVRPDGTFAGFSVESFRAIADAAGVAVQFEEIAREEWAAGPAPWRYDVIPQLGIDASRQARMDFTTPVDRSWMEITTRAGEAEGVSDLESLRGKRVGVEAVNLGRQLAEAHGGLDLTIYHGMEALLSGLLAGEVDAVIAPKLTLVREAERLGVLEALHQVQPPFHIVDRGIALRFGLGNVRERLNAVIPGYLASADYAALRQRYFQDVPYWTRERVQRVVGLAVIATLIPLILAIGALIWRRRSQERLQNAQIRALNADLKLQVASKEAVNAELRAFAYATSHDLKSPTSTTTALLEEFQQAFQEGDMALCAELIEDLASTNRRMGQALDDVLDYTNAMDGSANHERVALGAMVDEVVASLSGEISAVGAKVSRSDLPVVWGHPVQLRQLTWHLLDNALKFRAPERPLDVMVAEAEAPDGWVAIAFRDNGIGIAEAHQARIFKIFERLNPEAGASSSGLGLSICQRVAYNHAGRIEVSSRVGEGTVFTLLLGAGGDDPEHDAHR